MSDSPESPKQHPLASDSTLGFVHLRLHTEFSIVDGLVRIKPLLARARELAMPAIAVTDLANMFGLIKFYSGAIKEGIKPICGCDVLVKGEEGAADTRLLLLAKDREGYLNISRLISTIYTENPNRSDASLRFDQLAEYSEGVIALSGGQFSDIGASLLEGDHAKAVECLARWEAIFPRLFLS